MTTIAMLISAIKKSLSVRSITLVLLFMDFVLSKALTVS